MILSVFSVLLFHAVLSSENNTEFKSINEKSEIWNRLKNFEEDILTQFTTSLRSSASYEVLQKEINEKLKDFHERDDHVELFLDQIAKKHSTALAQAFNDNFQYNKHIATKKLEYKAIAFKAVEMYYLEAVGPILEKHKLKMNSAWRLILDFLSDHRGFGPAFEIAYIPPSSHNSREKLEFEFDALTTEAPLKKILPWLAHRYLRADFGAKLSEMVENIKCTEYETRIITPFNKGDLKYVENLNLIQIFSARDHDILFQNVIKQELTALFRKLGNIKVCSVIIGTGNYFKIDYKKQK